MSGADQLKEALKRKQTGNPQPLRPTGSIPDPIVYATDGVDKDLLYKGEVVGRITYERST